MTMPRISLSEVATKIETDLGAAVDDLGEVYAGSSADSNFSTKFKAIEPSVFVLAQKSSPKDDGKGFTGMYRQNLNVDVAIQIRVPRSPQRTYNNEELLGAIYSVVSDAVLGWKPLGASRSFVFQSSQDGNATEPMISILLLARTEVVNSRTL